MAVRACSVMGLALAVGGCPAQPQPLVIVPPPPVAKSVPPEPPCVAKAETALKEIERLQEHGDLDRAFLALAPHWSDCSSAHPELYGVRFTLLQDLDYHEEARALAVEVAADEAAPAAAKKLGARLLAAPPKRVTDELAHATRMAEEGKREAAAKSPERAQMAFDRALHANLRGTHHQPRVAALSRFYELQLLDDDHVVVPVREMPANAGHALVMKLTRDGGELRAAPERLVGQGEGTPTLSASSDGAFALNYEDKTAWYASPSAEPVELPSALHVNIGPGGVVVLVQRDAVEIRAASQPATVIARRPSTLGADDRATQVVQLVEGRFVALCEEARGAESVVVVDTKTKAVTVGIDEVLQCRVDEARQQLVVMRAVPKTSPAKVVVELYPLDGRPHTTARFQGALTTEAAYLAPLRDELAHASSGLDGQRREMFVRLSDGRAVARPPVTDRGPLRNIPIGSASDDTDISPLASLSIPPRKVFEPYFAHLQVWTHNGVRSFDRKTVAVFDASADGDDVQLIIADTTPLKVRHRISLPMGINWLTAFFRTDQLLVVQSYPEQMVFDVATGEQVADLDMTDFFELRTLRPDLIAHGTNLWSVAQGKHEVDLHLMDGHHWQGKDGVFRAQLVDGSLTLNADGTVLILGGVAPDWLYCRFGDRLVEWAVCRGRLSRRPPR